MQATLKTVALVEASWSTDHTRWPAHRTKHRAPPTLEPILGLSQRCQRRCLQSRWSSCHPFLNHPISSEAQKHKIYPTNWAAQIQRLCLRYRARPNQAETCTNSKTTKTFGKVLCLILVNPGCHPSQVQLARILTRTSMPMRVTMVQWRDSTTRRVPLWRTGWRQFKTRCGTAAQICGKRQQTMTTTIKHL